MSLNEIFSQIYEKKYWGSKISVGSDSGEGSNPDIALPYVNFIKQIIVKYKVESVLDFGHGDWEMWRDFQFENLRYTGLDVVEFLSIDLSKKYGNADRKFITIDGDSVYPDSDLFICKDVFQHLSSRDIRKIWTKLDKFKLIVLCNDINLEISLPRKIRHFLQIRKRLQCIKARRWPFYYSRILDNNSEILSGEYRALDLENADFLSLNSYRIKIHLEILHRGLKRECVYGYCDFVGESYRPREFLIELDTYMHEELYIKTLLHELTHLKQWVVGSLRSKRGKMYYDKEPVEFYDYWQQPHEVEAREQEETLYYEYLKEKNHQPVSQPSQYFPNRLMIPV